jgi:hypothetical protein
MPQVRFSGPHTELAIRPKGRFGSSTAERPASSRDRSTLSTGRRGSRVPISRLDWWRYAAGSPQTEALLARGRGFSHGPQGDIPVRMPREETAG